MSADNYYVIRKHPNGGFAAIMGFASDEDGSAFTDPVNPNASQYASVREAYREAEEGYAEYGVKVAPECDDSW